MHIGRDAHGDLCVLPRRRGTEDIDFFSEFVTIVVYSQKNCLFVLNRIHPIIKRYNFYRSQLQWPT